MSYETILIERNEGITTIKFNRAEKKNAMSPAMHREMHDALSELAFDDETEVLVITGSGDSFSAGQDLKQYFYELKDSKKEREEIRRISNEWRHRLLYHFPKPTIAAINGWCFGGAFTIVSSCDIAIASEEARFGLSEINFGNIPGGIVARNVAEMMPPRLAMYYSLTGEQFNGRRGAEIGFLTMAVPKETLEQKTLEIATTLKGKDPIALRAVKEAFKGVDLKAMSYDDAWYWLSAKVNELTLLQKGGWVEEGIGKFIKGEYRPGQEAFKRN